MARAIWPGATTASVGLGVAILIGCGRSELIPRGRGAGGSADAAAAQVDAPASVDADGADTSPDAARESGGDGRCALEGARCTNRCVTEPCVLCAGPVCGPRPAPAVYPVTAHPSGMLGADFDHDGTTDLAVWSATEVDVLLGTGEGTFERPVRAVYASAATSVSPLTIVWGDVDGDGNLDFVVEASGPSRRVGLGRGNGSFRLIDALPPSATGSRLALVDTDADGRLDLVAAEPGADPLSEDFKVYAGNGDGTFQPGAGFVMALPDLGTPFFLKVVDANDDGMPDVALDYGLLLLGQGDGTFVRALGPGATLASALIVTDVDRDGRPDLISADRLTGSSPSSLFVALGNGDGSLQAAASVPLGGGAMSLPQMATGDLDRDGRPDLVIADRMSGLVSVFLGNGDGSFRPDTPARLDLGDLDTDDNEPYVPCGLALVDVDGDGWLDLALTSAAAQAVLVLHGRGDGTFEGARHVAIGSSFVTGDLNGDGAMDLVSATDVYLGTGRGDFVHVGSHPGTGPSAAADFNRDGDVDVLFFGDHVYLGRGDGALSSGPSARFADEEFRGVGDFNRDCYPDLVTYTHRRGGTQDSLNVHLGNGDGSFGDASRLMTGSSAVAIGDFDGDGRLDLVNVDESSLSFFPGAGDGSFHGAIVSGRALFGVQVITTGDLDRDGMIDLVLNGGDSASSWLGNGDGSFRRAASWSTMLFPPISGTRVDPAALVDFDGDGRLDLLGIARIVSKSRAVVFLGNGDGSFGDVKDLPHNVYEIPSTMLVGGVNPAGRRDILFGALNPFGGEDAIVRLIETCVGP